MDELNNVAVTTDEMTEIVATPVEVTSVPEVPVEPEKAGLTTGQKVTGLAVIVLAVFGAVKLIMIPVKWVIGKIKDKKASKEEAAGKKVPEADVDCDDIVEYEEK